jgi:hypothetical protein
MPMICYSLNRFFIAVPFRERTLHGYRTICVEQVMRSSLGPGFPSLPLRQFLNHRFAEV